MNSTWSILQFLQKHRIQKKQKLYKLAFGVAFDWTIAIYIAFFAFFLLFIAYDELKNMESLFISYGERIDQWFPLVVIGLIGKMLALSFQHPQIVITSAEWKLTSLPFSMKKIWRIFYVAEWAKRACFYLVMFLFISVIFPFDRELLFTWFLTLFVASSLLILPQWHLFQLAGRQKMQWYLFIVFMMIIWRFVSLILDDTIWLVIVVGCLLFVNLFLWMKRFQQVDWMKVIDANDVRVWRMFFIEKMSDVEIESTQRQGIFSQIFRTEKDRQPFPYKNERVVFRRIWKRTLLKAKGQLLQLIGSIVLVLFILGSLGQWEFGLAISLTMFMFTKIIGSYFYEGLHEKMIHSLPWRIQMIKRSFLDWTIRLAVIYCILLLVAFIVLQTTSIFMFIQFILYISSLYYLLQLTINEHIYRFHHKWWKKPWQQNLIVIGIYIVMACSIALPLFSLFFVIVLGIMLQYKKEWNKFLKSIS
ncbi:hypothetical protein J416_11070 [Gracilibacillus halophilus YIM-C55.5]|uniref:Uncharacterized protein n=1 Tax=Gracilibacillus halophilus YIM-C55.5 TaxID=1308866 RepID=N4WPH3_9BACI|nr:hypothetical protein [Gracilibacillus halophilus]ENH96380.1 hypothetical protein J416_11070 [Gracilibacillus halophilus YIM-C55.5]